MLELAQAPTTPPSWRKILPHDLAASVVVFLVALPLSMGIALASGAPILAGLVAGAVGGIVVGALAGAPLQVSGPAAGMAVISFGLIQQYGFPALCAITVGAGALQILLGFARVGRVVMAISPAVLHGMLAGIGILITLSQLHIVLGGTPESSAWKNLLALPDQIADLHGVATVLGVTTIGILVLWPLLPLKRLRVPAALVAVVLVTGISILWGREVPRVQLPDSLLGSFVPPALPQGNLGGILGAVLTVALVASAESLVCAVATDKLHSGPRAKLDRELIAQGAGNLLSGLLGGLPITGVIVRSTANIDSGARTRLSTILHGVWMLIFVSLLGALLTRIPLSVLAGLLCVVGSRLVHPSDIRELIRHREGTVYFATLGGVVGINLLAGLGLGVAVALFQLLWRLSRVQIEKKTTGDRWQVTFRGYLTFLTVPQITAALAALPRGARVDVNLNTEVLDHAAFEALHAWRLGYERTGGTVDIDQVHELRPRLGRAASPTSNTSKDRPAAALDLGPGDPVVAER
ncbi:MAG TPA: SulP family inorganic anion transporter [Polyangia bacterium]|jgi:carbonic anhydrase|nr:SulP family inorganic anion transporter [Polyangia bacterium]